MPHTMVQLEQRLEPFVKRFHGLTAAAVERAAAATFVEVPSYQAQAVRLIARLDGFPAGLGFGGAFVLGAHPRAYNHADEFTAWRTGG